MTYNFHSATKCLALLLYNVVLRLCSDSVFCQNDHDCVVNMQCMPPVQQTSGVLQNKNSLQFQEDGLYPYYSADGVSLMKIHQNILQRLGTLGNSQTIARESCGYAKSGSRGDKYYKGGGEKAADGRDNSRLLFGLREVETLPGKKQRFGLPIQGHNMKLKLFKGEKIGKSSFSNQEQFSVAKFTTENTNKLHINRDVKNENFPMSQTERIQNELPNFYRENKTIVGTFIDKENEERNEKYFFNKSNADKIALENPPFKMVLNGKGKANILDGLQNQNTKTLLRILTDKNGSSEPPVNKELYEKKIIRIVARTETGFLNSKTGNMNLMGVKSTSTMVFKEEGEENKTDNIDCGMCRAIVRRIDKKYKETSNNRDGIDPNCEMCISEYKAKRKETAAKLESDHNERNSKKMSSRNNNEFPENIEKIYKVKMNVTTCRPEDCIKKIKELIENIQASTSFQSEREKIDQKLNTRHIGEDVQPKKGEKSIGSNVQSGYGTNTKTSSIKNTENTKPRDKVVQKDKSRSNNQVENNVMSRKNRNNLSIMRQKRKRKRKHVDRQKKNTSTNIKYKIQEGDKDFKNKRNKYPKYINDTDDDVQEKANNMRFFLFEKIKAQNNNENDEYDEDDEYDDDYEGNDEADNIRKETNKVEEEYDEIHMSKRYFKHPSMYKETEFNDERDNDVILKLPMRILRKLRSVAEHYLEMLDINSSPDVIILALLVIIIVLLIGIFITVKRFNRKHEMLMDSHTDMQWIALNMHAKYDATCPHVGTQQVFRYQENLNNLKTVVSYSDILKKLYMSEKSAIQRSSHISLCSSLPTEFRDEETRKIIHGKRHLRPNSTTQSEKVKYKEK